MEGFYPRATRFLVPWNYQRENGVDRVPLFIEKPDSWVLHVAETDGPLRWFRDLKTNLRFSHLWFGKDGEVEQYGDLRRISWAQVNGNKWGWSLETAGHADEPLTDAQLTELARWHVWCGAADRVTDYVTGHGIGTHSMGGAAWGGHACPGVIRAGQRQEIIRRAIALRAGTDPEEDEMKTTDPIKLSNGTTTTVERILGSMYLGTLAIRNQTDELESWLRANTGHVIEQNKLMTAQNELLLKLCAELKRE
jgi:hypothetical protein